MDSPSGHSVLGSRRGLKIRPIQTNINNPNTRQQRPPRPNDEPAQEPAPERAPLKPQSSKSSLKNLFSRNKTNRRSNHEHTLPAISESQKVTAASIIPDTISSPNSPSTTPMTPKSSVATSSPLTGKTGSSNPSKTSKSSKEKGQKLQRAITVWDPPPLFQAYPQAIKQGTLPAPTLSTVSLLRMKGHRRNSSEKDDFSDVDADDDRASSRAAKRRKDEKDKKHSRKASGSNKPEWTQKIFILVTSGYLLQYSGDGSFDRLPEKMMELGQNSVAFASDAIPGRHWVLQISQTLEEDGTVALDTKKTFLSRFGFADSRRQTKTLLLVCNDPAEMTSWLTAVRREIEALGGKEYTPETPLKETSQDSEQSQKRFIRQSIIPDKTQSVPMNLANPGCTEPSPVVSSPNGKEEQKPKGNRPADEASLRSTNRRSIRPQSVEAPSLSTTGTVTDLDRLREGSRLSYVSIGTRTIPSSRGSSPGLSPARQKGVASMTPCAESPSSVRSTVADSSSTHMSIHAYSSKQSEGSGTDTPGGSRPTSTVGPLISRSTSPPNFSVPVLSKRFTSTHSGPPPSSRKFYQTSPPSPRIIIPNTWNRLSGLDDSAAPPQLPNGQPESKKAFKGPDHTQLSVPFIFDPETPSRASALPKPRERKTRRYSSFESTRAAYSVSSDYRPQLSPVTNESSEEGCKSDTLSHRNPHRTYKQVDDAPKKGHEEARQLRRPMSMQIGSEARRRAEATHPLHATTTRTGFPSPDGRTSYRRNRTSLPHPEIIRDTSPPNNNHHLPDPDRGSLQKSTSHLSLGAPVAPPPDFPLPKVPPRVASQFRPAWHGHQQQLALGPTHDESGRLRSRNGPDGPRSTHTVITPVDLRDVENSPRLSGMTAKEYSMVNAF
ncbi:peptidase family M20/M25/M40 protein [Blastomyces dermatitidis ER-3]|uniref:Peptidase family M20/M25/M40 protein n=2 Tax=Ajellomyces dermatitidis TaxID=5039 RepID=F2T337_AJEDA|nr:peptidase family M20/M25/M40 protein [Blastomyces dermatitidis ER-3]EEQ87570.1 peptidase family M20/M25/M40 protein [Blastomyces dermatitidis ER-3]EGE77839.1 peptidase family M20/M25/M40 protein [Blastomyces dermatitidis ATCC 18188]